MKNILYTTILAFVVSVTAGCGMGGEIRNVQIGENEKDVINKLGEPNSQHEGHDVKSLLYSNRLISGWSWDRKDYVVVFKDGAVMAKSDNSPDICVDITSQSETIIANEKYYIDMGKNSMRNSRVGKMVKSIMAHNGLSIVESVNLANCIVAVNYGISDPKTFKWDRPIYETVGGETKFSMRTTDEWTGDSYYSSGSMVSPTRQRLAGVVQESEIYYIRHLSLNAFEINDDRKLTKEKWSVRSVSKGSMSNLDLIIPALVFSLNGYFGSDHLEEIRLIIPSNNEASNAIMKFLSK